MRIGFDAVAGGPPAERLPGSEVADESADYSLVFDPEGDEGAGSAQLWSREELDACLLDYPYLPSERPIKEGWVRQQLTINYPLTVPTTGEDLAPEFQEVGTLRRGSWDPADDQFDSRSSWRVDGATIIVRIPWTALGISDPSSKQALTVSPPTEDGAPYIGGSTPVETVGVVIEVGDERVEAGALDWEPWEAVAPNTWSRRLKVGSDQVAALMGELGKPG